MSNEAVLHIIADDLTGAADTGIQFAKRNLNTILIPFSFVEPSCDPGKVQVVAINTDSRRMSSERTYDKVKKAALPLKNQRIIYKKIDSTLRGNIGIEIEAVMETTGIGLAIVAPAFPVYDRTTLNGVHFVNGQPLSQTEAASDPVTPVNKSHIPSLIREQTSLEVGQIGLDDIRRGQISLRRIILQRAEDGERIIVFDAETDDDLSIIAEASMSISPTPLMVGSAGLADQLSRILERRENTRHRVKAYNKRDEGAIIIVSGSLSTITWKQLDVVRETGKGDIISVDIGEIIEAADGDSSQEDEIISKIMSSMNTIGVAGVQSSGTYHIAPEYVHEDSLIQNIVDCLGELAAKVIERYPQPIRGLILTGGDTALAVFKHLGISCVQLVDEILPGIPYGQIKDGKFAGLTVVTKAGAFGNESALVECINFLM